MKNVRDFRSCLMIDLGRETDGNNEICLGVHFCLVHFSLPKMCTLVLAKSFALFLAKKFAPQFLNS